MPSFEPRKGGCRKTEGRDEGERYLAACNFRQSARISKQLRSVSQLHELFARISRTRSAHTSLAFEVNLVSASNSIMASSCNASPR